MLIPPPAGNEFGRQGHPPLLALLYNQRMIELCTLIPTYVHTLDGWDRAVARHAFAADLPQKVVTRRSKGAFEDSARRVRVRHRVFLREMLLDGSLVREGILDRGATEKAISIEPTDSTATNIELFDALFVAAWISQLDTLQRCADLH